MIVTLLVRRLLRVSLFAKVLVANGVVVALGAGAGGALGNGVARLDHLRGGLSAGLGLFGSQERTALVGGRFILESTPGAGTTVRAVIPLTERAERVAP